MKYNVKWFYLFMNVYVYIERCISYHKYDGIFICWIHTHKRSNCFFSFPQTNICVWRILKLKLLQRSLIYLGMRTSDPSHLLLYSSCSHLNFHPLITHFNSENCICFTTKIFSCNYVSSTAGVAWFLVI